MQKWALSLVLSLISGVVCAVSPLSAEDAKDVLAIKKAIKNYYNAMAGHNLDSMMEQISAHYIGFDMEGNITDYSKHKSNLERELKTFSDISINDLKMSDLNVRDNKAALEVEYNYKAFNINKTKNENSMRRLRVSLVKEDGSWKIINIQKKVIDD